mmetsp:Transcript_1183/g.1523  ORF Transcript_1183/g.1523 Transcript_1183/m.1523 type:complete len:249 (+) Transcript_1183:180-926(+)|eukprot:CAMPEP_0117751808 /NCGR_PEP_ID=MMETSP0947-20121206/11208_1 /TAXON_ID=44440 /ORGANISM="Chattonella subsalsa, Strain CCMP2191" /LENGTH=248 /DNA_ID=CAMNT_0005570285 /DNA_START=280 /DNA_END=1026 /DNA_ORIENTATION=+
MAEIHRHCQEGNLKDVRKLIEQTREEIEHRTEDDNTPLICASMRGHYNVVKYLLQHGAEIDAVNKHGSSALYQAASFGHQHVVSLLLLYGAQLELASKIGGTPLNAAVSAGHEAIVQLLLYNGANPDSVNKFGNSALSRAIDNNHKGIATALFARGAHLDEKISTNVDQSEKAKSWGLAQKVIRHRRRENTIPSPIGNSFAKTVAAPRPNLGRLKTKSVPDLDKICVQHYEVCLIEIEADEMMRPEKM